MFSALPLNTLFRELIPKSSIHSYWLFYSLNGEYKIPFEKYHEMYKLFENDIEVQSLLLLGYKDDIRKAPRGRRNVFVTLCF